MIYVGESNMTKQWRNALAVVAAVLGTTTGIDTAVAQTATTATADPNDDLLQYWLAMVDRNRSEEPDWLTPLVTTSARLSNGFRFDALDEHVSGTKTVTNYGNGKGLQLIPFDNTEIDLYAPPYLAETGKTKIAGFGDWPAVNVKYRFLTATASQGDYVVSGYVTTVAPSGINALTNHTPMITPGIAAGKGWGNFILQGNVGEAFPFHYNSKLGNATTANLAAEYRIGAYFWPEVEFNETYWPNGAKEGKNQMYVTPGIQLGRIPLYDRVKMQFGVGYQYALSPAVPSYKHAWILSMRLIW